MSQNAFNLLDGLRPLKRYLSLTPLEEAVKSEHSIKNRSDEMISDWGIDTESANSPTLVNIDVHRTSLSSSHNAGLSDSHGHFDDDSTITSTVISRPYDVFNVVPRNNDISIEVILNSIFMRFHEIHTSFQRFHDEFKYILITSQLLDETILISKYRKKLSSLQLNYSPAKIVTKFGNVLTALQKQVLLSENDTSSISQINLILFVKHMLRNHKKFTKRQQKAIIIIITVNIYIQCNYRYINFKIIELTMLNNLKTFIKNYQKLDISLVKLLNKFKELTLFPVLANNSGTHCSRDTLKSEKIHEILSSSTLLSINCILNNLNRLFNCVNGFGLENYCGMYNVHLDELNHYLLNEFISPQTSTYERLSLNLKKFQYLRRFLICCLLSVNETHHDSTFLEKALKVFQYDREEPKYLNGFQKLNLLSITLENVFKFSDLLNTCLLDFINVEKTSTSNTENMNQLDIKMKPSYSSTQLSAKLKEMQLNLITLDRTESVDNQILEFSKIGESLASINQTYYQHLSDLQSISQTNRPFNLSPNSSMMIPSSNSKEFKKLVSRRKRFSLPPQQQFSPIQVPKNPSRSVCLNSQGNMGRSTFTDASSTSTPTNYKRLSTGLSIPLLTVTENENDVDAVSNRKVSYDDNYINITPSLQTPGYFPEGFSEEPRDYIGEKQLLSRDDSVIISSSAKDEDESAMETNVLDNIEFKNRLERNFDRILSTSTAIGNSTNIDDSGYLDDSLVNEIQNDDTKNNAQGVLLMDELKAKMERSNA